MYGFAELAAWTLLGILCGFVAGYGSGFKDGKREGFIRGRIATIRKAVNR
jgi:hypothetical protein